MDSCGTREALSAMRGTFLQPRCMGRDATGTARPGRAGERGYVIACWRDSGTDCGRSVTEVRGGKQFLLDTRQKPITTMRKMAGGDEWNAIGGKKRNRVRIDLEDSNSQ